jgi:hypothetical protein
VTQDPNDVGPNEQSTPSAEIEPSLTDGQHTMPVEVVRTGPSAIRTALDALRGIVPLVEGVARSIVVYALFVLAGAAAIWWAILERSATGPGRAATLTVWAIVLAFPPAMLLTVALALRLLAGLPDRLAALPERAREHASSLGRLANEARRVRARGWLRSGASVFRLWRTAAASRDLIEIAAPVAFVFSPLTLFLLFLSAVAGIVVILGGGIALLWLLLT